MHGHHLHTQTPLSVGLTCFFRGLERPALCTKGIKPLTPDLLRQPRYPVGIFADAVRPKRHGRASDLAFEPAVAVANALLVVIPPLIQEASTNFELGPVDRTGEAKHDPEAVVVWVSFRTHSQP